MPLTAKGEKIMKSMKETYGEGKKAEKVFYASRNKGVIKGVDADESAQFHSSMAALGYKGKKLHELSPKALQQVKSHAESSARAKDADDQSLSWGGGQHEEHTSGPGDPSRMDTSERHVAGVDADALDMADAAFDASARALRRGGLADAIRTGNKA